MSFHKAYTFVIYLLCLSPVSSTISNHFRRKTNLDFRRDVNVPPMLVPSLIDCATLCARRSKCVSFFFNLLESLCQFDGKIYVSFDGDSAGFWSYYGIIVNMFMHLHIIFHTLISIWILSVLVIEK